MTVTNFNSGSLADNTGVASVTCSGWMLGSSEWPVLLNQSSRRPVLFDCSGKLSFKPACNNTGAIRFSSGSSIQ